MARREHSRYELVRKLKSKGVHASEVDDLVATLEQEGLQSDEQFIEAFIHSRQTRGYGPLKIQQELRQRGVKADLIHQFLSLQSDEWFVLAQREYDKKFAAGSSSRFSNAERAKRVRFLQARGYPNDIIYKIIK